MKTKLSELLEKITPLPYALSDTSIVTEKYCIAVIEDDGGYEAPERDENAAYLIHAANMLPEVVEKLRDAIEILKMDFDYRPDDNDHWESILATLARAEEFELK